MSGSVTVFENTDGLTVYAGVMGPLSATTWRGFGFTTAGGSSWELSGLRLNLFADTGGSYSVDIGLYATIYNGVTGRYDPSGSALGGVSLAVTVTDTPGYLAFDKAVLSGVGSATLAADTHYALVLAAYSGGLKLGFTSGKPAGGAGFTYDRTLVTDTAGGTWNTTGGFSPLLQMDVQATCFLRGTLILTARGEVPVEALRAGDLVATKFGGLRPVRWIGTQRFEGRLAGAGHQPIRFARGSLGGGMPSCDLWVSPGHAMLVGDVLVHAGALANGSTIVQEKVRGVIEYFHLDLGPHDCVLANGAWAESYFEDRNRDSFHNAADFHARFPGHEAVRQATCLPVVTVGHPGIAALRARLAPAGVRRAA